MSEIAETYKIALAADEAFDRAVLACGFKSRWDWTPSHPRATDASRTAYQAKRAADDASHAAWERKRAEQSTGRAA